MNFYHKHHSLINYLLTSALILTLLLPILLLGNEGKQSPFSSTNPPGRKRTFPGPGVVHDESNYLVGFRKSSTEVVE